MSFGRFNFLSKSWLHQFFQTIKRPQNQFEKWWCWPKNCIFFWTEPFEMDFSSSQIYQSHRGIHWWNSLGNLRGLIGQGERGLSSRQTNWFQLQWFLLNKLAKVFEPLTFFVWTFWWFRFGCNVVWQNPTLVFETWKHQLFTCLYKNMCWKFEASVLVTTSFEQPYDFFKGPPQ